MDQDHSATQNRIQQRPNLLLHLWFAVVAAKLLLSQWIFVVHHTRMGIFTKKKKTQ